MEWIKNLQGKTVGLDTAPIIYFIEEHPVYLETVVAFFKAMDRGEFVAVTSTVTLLEVLVHPLRNNMSTLATEYREILLNSSLNTKDLSGPIAEQAAQLRANYNLRTPPHAVDGDRDMQAQLQRRLSNTYVVLEPTLFPHKLR
ncbi:MAG: hypothetical protein A2511_00285 [Deltaproteobacteria bacterium RIFOXYD12_FULL_50_9]|nr:MAG: hypothetical protein A2511_00285 [Deltaproteobacteria bacterium RIFOXYD12_FULL_50_9]